MEACLDNVEGGLNVLVLYYRTSHKKPDERSHNNVFSFRLSRQQSTFLTNN